MTAGAFEPPAGAKYRIDLTCGGCGAVTFYQQRRPWGGRVKCPGCRAVYVTGFTCTPRPASHPMAADSAPTSTPEPLPAAEAPVEDAAEDGEPFGRGRRTAASYEKRKSREAIAKHYAQVEVDRARAAAGPAPYETRSRFSQRTWEEAELLNPRMVRAADAPIPPDELARLASDLPADHQGRPFGIGALKRPIRPKERRNNKGPRRREVGHD